MYALIEARSNSQTSTELLFVLKSNTQSLTRNAEKKYTQHTCYNQFWCHRVLTFLSKVSCNNNNNEKCIDYGSFHFYRTFIVDFVLTPLWNLMTLKIDWSSAMCKLNLKWFFFWSITKNPSTTKIVFSCQLLTFLSARKQISSSFFNYRRGEWKRKKTFTACNIVTLTREYNVWLLSMTTNLKNVVEVRKKFQTIF